MICRVFRKRKKFHLTFSNQYIFFLLLTTQHICVSTYYVPYHTESWRIKVARLTMYLLRLVTTWLLPAQIFGVFNNIKIKNEKKYQFWILILLFGSFIFQFQSSNLKEFILNTAQTTISNYYPHFEFRGFPRNQKTGCWMNARPMFSWAKMLSHLENLGKYGTF